MAEPLVGEKAVAIIPINKDAYGWLDKSDLDHTALHAFSKMGTCIPGTIEKGEVTSDQLLVGKFLRDNGMSNGLPTDLELVLVRYTAYVVPNEENKERFFDG